MLVGGRVWWQGVIWPLLLLGGKKRERVKITTTVVNVHDLIQTHCRFLFFHTETQHGKMRPHASGRSPEACASTQIA